MNSGASSFFIQSMGFNATATDSDKNIELIKEKDGDFILIQLD
jgi:hypothetical protein